MGVFSLSEEAPVKQSNFREADKELEGKMRYTEWRFAYNPPQTSPQSVPLSAAAATPSPLLATKPPAGQTAPVSPVAQKPINESLCDTLLKNDAVVCQTMASKYGEETAKLCAESAEERFAECRERQTVIGLPPLKIQFDPKKERPQ
jgi:hypothetical protein